MRIDFIFLIGAFLFAFEGCRQFYFKKNVDRLEAEGRFTPDVAARIRKKPVWYFWLAAGATIGFLAKGFFVF
jgi:hypothetical protein